MYRFSCTLSTRRIPSLVRVAICQRNGVADDNWNVKDGNGNRVVIWCYPTAVNKMTSGTIGARDESYDYRARNTDPSCKSLRASIVSGDPRYERKFNYAKPLKVRGESIEPEGQVLNEYSRHRSPYVTA